MLEPLGIVHMEIIKRVITELHMAVHTSFLDIEAYLSIVEPYIVIEIQIISRNLLVRLIRAYIEVSIILIDIEESILPLESCYGRIVLQYLGRYIREVRFGELSTE